MRPDYRKYIYFIRRADGEGPIKVGCSCVPKRRLIAITQWSPYPLTILASAPGEHWMERKLHRHFASSRSHFEWFHPTQELLSAIALIAQGADFYSAVAFTAPPDKYELRELAKVAA
jgi:hypothetical protein